MDVTASVPQMSAVPPPTGPPLNTTFAGQHTIYVNNLNERNYTLIF